MMQKEQKNADWLDQLRRDGPQQTEGIEALRQLLLRAALYTVSQHSQELPGRSPQEVLALAEDCAQDALIAILAHLDEFRGESRFTTWAYKFAVHKALEALRRERWKDRSLDPLAEEPGACEWVKIDTNEPEDPGISLVQAEIWRLIHQVICQELTNRQRQVVKWMVFDEVPMDVVTNRLQTNRNAVYKILHDTRRKIKNRIEEQGYSTDEILALFSTPSLLNKMELSESDCL